jgi:hypothetical protein
LSNRLHFYHRINNPRQRRRFTILGLLDTGKLLLWCSCMRSGIACVSLSLAPTPDPKTASLSFGVHNHSPPPAALFVRDCHLPLILISIQYESVSGSSRSSRASGLPPASGLQHGISIPKLLVINSPLHFAPFLRIDHCNRPIVGKELFYFKYAAWFMPFSLAEPGLAYELFMIL